MKFENGWEVRFEENEALLFALASDGTVSMRALPVEEWKRHLTTDYAENLAANRVEVDTGSDGTPNDAITSSMATPTG